jgi:cystathionine gamma-lyase
MKKETKYIHAEIHPDTATGAIMTPIYQTATFVQEKPGVHKGYEYARTGNPTREVLQKNLAAIENGKYGICFASGMAAMDAVMKTLDPGDEIVSTNDLYGGSYRLMVRTYGKYGIKSSFADFTDLGEIEKRITKKTRLIWIETPSNPLLKVFDLEAICRLAADNKILTCVDNTFATPYLQNPIDFGTDIVLHSATKYLGGHSDSVLGALVVNDDKLAEQLYYQQNATGGIPGPMDCFLILRGIKTLHVRMDRSCFNAQVIANFLANHPKVSRVYFPGLPDNPYHEIASRQMHLPGAMLSFDLTSSSMEDAGKVLASTEIFALAESLGGVESLIGHPASMTHASIPAGERRKAGLGDALIRLSVGIEHTDDLIADLDQALDKI